MIRNWLRIGLVFGFSIAALLFTQSAAFGTDDRGRAVFKLCSYCHGINGEGNIKLQAPAIAGLPEWYIVAQLKKFREGVRGTHPQDFPGMRMRPMARALNGDSDVAAVAGYVAGLPRTHPVDTVVGSIVKGETTFQVCQACHGPAGAGNKDVNAPPLAGASDWYIINQLKAFKAGVRAGDPAKDPIGAGMRPMAMTLDEETMNNVAAYINTFKDQ